MQHDIVQRSFLVWEETSSIKSYGCYILFREVSTLPLYSITMTLTWDMGVVKTSHYGHFEMS